MDAGQTHAQKKRPKRMINKTATPTDSHNSGSKLLLAKAAPKKPNGQVILKIPLPNVHNRPKPDLKTVPETIMPAINNMLAVRKNHTGVIVFFLFFIIVFDGLFNLWIGFDDISM